MKTALIIGINGQDGSYIASQLLQQGYQVCGTTRKKSTGNTSHNHSLLAIADSISIYELDITNTSQTYQLLDYLRPDIIYHLGGLTSVSLSFTDPIEAFTSICQSTLNLLECVHLNHRHARVFIPCSSDCFGQTNYGQPATEKTLFNPRSPYALAKSSAYDLSHFYRKQYGLFVSVGILSNHKSPLRGPHFVTSKIVRSIHSILNGSCTTLKLGNISVVRDWCWAPDVTMGIIKLMELNSPETVILASGKSSSLEELISIMFMKSGLGDYQPYVSCSNELIRTNEVSSIFLSPTKASQVIPWTHTTTLDQIAEKLLEQALF